MGHASGVVPWVVIGVLFTQGGCSSGDEDDPGACTPLPEVCDRVDDDCDGQVDEDFPPPAIPGCHDPRRVLGWFSGDRDDQGALVVTGSQEEWLELWVSEDEHVFLQPKDLAIRLTLTGAGVDEFDLVARCMNCSAPAIASDWWSHQKEIPFMVNDGWLSDDDVVLLSTSIA
jgi:hypothetical protein